MFIHMLEAKFEKSVIPVLLRIPWSAPLNPCHQVVASTELTSDVVLAIMRNIVQQKYEQRLPSEDHFDDFIRSDSNPRFEFESDGYFAGSFQGSRRV